MWFGIIMDTVVSNGYVNEAGARELCNHARSTRIIPPFVDFWADYLSHQLFMNVELDQASSDGRGIQFPGYAVRPAVGIERHWNTDSPCMVYDFSQLHNPGTTSCARRKCGLTRGLWLLLLQGKWLLETIFRVGSMKACNAVPELGLNMAELQYFRVGCLI